MRILTKILATITNKPRYFPEIKWSNKSWTHNVFRFYESIFGRKDGIRPEMSATAVKEKGRITVKYKPHTFEAKCALFEQYIRAYLNKLKNPNWLPVRIEINKVAVAGELVGFSPFMFAIAYDNSTNSGAGSGDVSFAFTVTGSNMGMLINGGQGSNNNPTFSATYNSVSATATDNKILMNNNQPMQSFYLNAPATGSNTVVFHSTTSTGSAAVAIGSYSGVKQSGQPSAHSTDAPASSFSNYTTPTITTTAANCWLVAGAYANLPASAGANTVVRAQDLTFLGTMEADSGAAIASSGTSQGLAFTSGVSSTTWGLFLTVLEPYVATSNRRIFPGIAR